MQGVLVALKDLVPLKNEKAVVFVDEADRAMQQTANAFFNVIDEGATVCGVPVSPAPPLPVGCRLMKRG